MHPLAVASYAVGLASVVAMLLSLTLTGLPSAAAGVAAALCIVAEFALDRVATALERERQTAADWRAIAECVQADAAAVWRHRNADVAPLTKRGSGA